MSTTNSQISWVCVTRPWPTPMTKHFGAAENALKTKKMPTLSEASGTGAEGAGGSSPDLPWYTFLNKIGARAPKKLNLEALVSKCSPPAVPNPRSYN